MSQNALLVTLWKCHVCGFGMMVMVEVIIAATAITIQLMGLAWDKFKNSVLSAMESCGTILRKKLSS